MEKSTIKVLHKFPEVKTEFGRINFILEKCRNKKVLHLGCVDEGLTLERIKDKSLLHLQLIEIATEVWGVDISEHGIETLKKNGIENLIVGDIEQIDQISKLKNMNFDVILLTEVLEHLNNPGLFLNNVKKIFDQETIMIITVPNGLRFTGLGRIIKGYEFVHPDHNYWFSYHTICTLLQKNHFQIEELRVYTLFDHTVSLYKKIYQRIKKENIDNKNPMNTQKSTTKNQQLKIPSLRYFMEFIIRRLIYKKNPFFVSDGIIVVVKPNKT